MRNIFIFLLIYFMAGCKPYYIPAYRLRLNNPNFQKHQTFRDKHGHNISWDTLSGVLYAEYGPNNGMYGENPNTYAADVCRVLFYVNHPNKKGVFIDTLNIKIGDVRNLPLQDSACLYLQRQLQQIKANVQAVQTQKSKNPHLAYKWIYNSGIIKEKEGIPDLYFTSVRKIKDIRRVALAFNAKILGTIYWDIHYDYSKGQQVTEAFESCPTCCWINQDCPPSDILAVELMTHITSLDTAQIRLLSLSPCDIQTMTFRDTPYRHDVSNYYLQKLPMYQQIQKRRK